MPRFMRLSDRLPSRGLWIFALVLATLPLRVAQGADLPLNTALREAHAQGALRGLHAVIAVYRGTTLAEVYFEGEDENWGRPLGLRQHGPDSLHDLRSVTKSITSLLYGIALDKGLVPPPSASLLAQFDEYPELAADPRRRALTIEDALTMRMGHAWNEALPYTDPRNSEIAMELAPDRYHYVLSRPMTDQPGTKWVYNGGAVALIARVIEKGAGMPLDRFARETLFAPLGITDFEWARGADGVPSAASGLRLSARSLLRIGEMLKAGGVHDGARIVSEQWLAEMRAPRTELEFGLRYGYLWWLPQRPAVPRWFAGFGNGGQRLTVNTEDDLILVVLGGRYNEPEDWKLPVTVITDFLVPALREHTP